jgi:hypothetical protein
MIKIKKQEFKSISLNEVECGLLQGEKEGEDAHLVDDPDVSIGLELCAPIDSSAGGRINSLALSIARCPGLQMAGGGGMGDLRLWVDVGC